MPSSVNSTPQKPTTGGNVSNTQTRESVDQFLADDYKNNAFSSVTLRVFLEHVFGFDSNAVSIWEPRAQEILVSCAKEITAYRDKASRSKETDLYEPFVTLANAVIKAAGGLEPNGNLLDIVFRKYGENVIKGKFGRRKPDVSTLPAHVDSANPGWEDVLLTWEFKPASAKRKLEEDEVTNSTDSKRSRVSKGKGSQDRLGIKETHVTRSGASTSSANNLSRGSAIASNSKAANPKSPKVQLTSYIAEMFSSATFHEWACGGSVDGYQMTLRYYDRTCSVSTQTFRYIQEDIVDFVLLLVAISSCDFLKFGYSDLFRYPDPSKSVTLIGTTLELTEPIKQIPDEKMCRMDWKGDETIKLEENLHTTYAVFGRATFVYKVSVGHQVGEKWEDRSGKESLVIKASWQVKTRKSEEEIVQEARKVDSEHTPAMFIAFTRERILPSDKLKDFCEEKGSYWEARVLRFIVFRQYRPLYELKGEVYLKAFIEIVICHWVIYDKGNILHRDLSIHNLMYDYRDGRIVGILNDFDLAVVLNSDKTSPPPSSNHRTGTAAFMARELLDERNPATHVYRHDLESFLYIVIWTAVGYKGSWHPNGRNDLLQKWRRGSWLDINQTKSLLFLETTDYEVISDNVSEDYKTLADFIDDFYETFRLAFTQASTASAAYLKTHRREFERGREIRNELLDELLSWDKVEHLFKKAA